MQRGHASLTTPAAPEIHLGAQTQALPTRLRLSPLRWGSASATDPATATGACWEAVGRCQRHSQKLLQPRTPWELLDGNAALQPLQSHNKLANSSMHAGQKTKLQCCTTAQDQGNDFL